jgi:xylulokinase
MPPGAEGLILIPYWNSVMNPYWDASASGITLGWRGHHKPAHLYQAILEGISFELRLHFEGVKSALNSNIEHLVAIGGGSKSDLWCQIIADITGKTILRTEIPEATALGAGMIAAYGVGLFDEIRAASREMSGKIQDQFETDAERHKIYSQLYDDVYQHLFKNLQPFVQRLASITGKNQNTPASGRSFFTRK